MVTVQPYDKDGSPVPMEQALEFAIQAGAEDVQESQDEEENDIYKVRRSGNLDIKNMGTRGRRTNI